MHLLSLEHVRGKVSLQPLVGVVDEELLEAVLVEALEPKDVQHADPSRPICVGRRSERGVCTGDDCVEHLAVKRTAQRVAGGAGLCCGEGRLDRVPPAVCLRSTLSDPSERTC